MSLRLLELAVPLAIQNVIISVGGLVVQYVINGFGFLFVAGFTASNKLYGVLEMAAVSYGYAITTYVGQNLGAKKIPEDSKRRAQRHLYGSAHFGFHFRHDGTVWT